MNVRHRFKATPPLEVSNAERMTITTRDGVEFEVVDQGDGLYILLNPLCSDLVIVPHASNSIRILSSQSIRQGDKR